MDSLLQMRLLVETEFTSFAAQNRTEEQIREFYQILQKEESTDFRNIQSITDLDFEFHLLIAIASGNTVYPLLLNSFRQVYTNLSGQFFKVSQIVNVVRQYHRDLVRALEAKDTKKALSIMKMLLRHGEKYLRKMIDNDTR
jgi:GntR family negative regulator for fad regulon and positive regulator of fabA